ncbi:MAG: ABC transporter ATP-binding protein [Methylocella sp.]
MGAMSRAALPASVEFEPEYVIPDDEPHTAASPTLARPSPPALAVERIGLAFGGVTALSQVDLAVHPGEIFAIIGPNGAGKSSLINVISGIYRPDTGLIRLGDQVFAAVPTDRLARLGVARTFQNLALFKGLSAIDNIVAGRVAAGRAGLLEQILGLSRARRERDDGRHRAESLLDFLDLGSIRDRLVGTLPYGVQKRVELARALVAQPSLLLLDEPMAGMTAGEKSEMAHFVRAARNEFGTTVVLIEHDIGIVMALSDRIAVLDYGRVIAEGAPSEIQSNQSVIDAYLGVAHEDDGGDFRDDVGERS